MSKLEKLIQELCPNGVEYKTLGEIGVFLGGLSGKKKDDFQNGNAKFITYKNVFSNPALTIDVDDKVKIGENEKQNTIQYGDVIFTGSSETPEECGMSSVLTQRTDEKLYLNSFCMIYRLNDSNLFLPDFLKHLFRSNTMRAQIVKTANGTTRFNVSKEKMKSVVMPVPPLEVQREIVHILDRFTLLTAELTAELTARRKQYEHYRDELLTYDIHNSEQEFAEVFDVITDFTAAGSFADLAKNVIYQNSPDYAQLVRTTDLKHSFNNADFVYIGKDAYDYLWRVQLTQESIVLPNIGVNCGEVYYVTPSKLPYQNNALGPNAILVRSTKNNNRFLFYLLHSQSFQKQLRRIISSGGQPKFNKTELKKLKLRLPSRDVQDKIVGVLDNFDAICADLNIGLPAEIEARQKQYEYYRDKLLTFKEIEV